MSVRIWYRNWIEIVNSKNIKIIIHTEGHRLLLINMFCGFFLLLFHFQYYTRIYWSKSVWIMYPSTYFSSPFFFKCQHRALTHTHDVIIRNECCFSQTQTKIDWKKRQQQQQQQKYHHHHHYEPWAYPFLCINWIEIDLSCGRLRRFDYYVTLCLYVLSLCFYGWLNHLKARQNWKQFENE